MGCLSYKCRLRPSEEDSSALCRGYCVSTTFAEDRDLGQQVKMPQQSSATATAAHTSFGPSPIDAQGPFELIANHWRVLQKVTVLPFDQSACHNAARLKSMVIIL